MVVELAETLVDKMVVH
jgi:hypothetical protein